MKTQIWLRPDQVDLLREIILFTKDRLNDGLVSSEAHKMAGRYTYRRLDELLAMLPVEQTAKGSKK